MWGNEDRVERESGDIPERREPSDPTRLQEALSDLSARQAQHDERTAARRYDFGLPLPSRSTGDLILPTGSGIRTGGARPWRVFLSHTSDLRHHPADRSYVDAAEAAVIRSRNAVIDMSYFAARDLEPAAYCVRMVAQADIYIGIVGHQYGAVVRGRPHQSYTELEFQAATELGLPRLVFLVRDGSAPSSAIDHETDGLVRQHAFRRRLQDSGVTTVWIGSPAELELGLLHALLELAADAHGPVADGGLPNIIVPTAGGEYEVLRDLERRRFLQWMVSTAVSRSVITTGHADQHNLELLRRTLDDAINDDAVSEATVADWEQAVLAHGRSTRDRPSGLMLSDLTGDLAELAHALDRCRSAAKRRRLTRVSAQMSGLMCLTLVKLDDRQAFRNWARSARIAAQEAGDPVTHSWVRAQEAYGHYYAGDLGQAIDVAQDAQRLAAQTPCVGAILAAALEARAQAALGRPTETRDALIRAEWILPRLDADSLVPSAFGYSEAQLRFHESSALTHLRDARGAWAAQERALQLTPEYDYTDRALTQLDRATCLVYEGDASAAAEYATGALASLTKAQRQGIILMRAQNIVRALPPHEATLPAVSDLRDLVMDSSSEGGE